MPLRRLRRMGLTLALTAEDAGHGLTTYDKKLPGFSSSATYCGIDGKAGPSHNDLCPLISTAGGVRR